MDTVKLPSFLKPLLWSYDFSRLNPEKYKKTIIVNAINYGNLEHWRWVNEFYGRDAVKKVLEEVPISELRPRVRKLAAILFSLTSFNNAPRGAQRTK